MEVVLDRKMAEKRIFPAIDILRSSTRRETCCSNRTNWTPSGPSAKRSPTWSRPR